VNKTLVAVPAFVLTTSSGAIPIPRPKLAAQANVVELIQLVLLHKVLPSAEDGEVSTDAKLIPLMMTLPEPEIAAL